VEQFVTLSVLIFWTQKCFKHIRSFVWCRGRTLLDAQLCVNICDLCNSTQVIPTFFTQWHLSGQEWSVGTARTTRKWWVQLKYYLLNSFYVDLFCVCLAVWWLRLPESTSVYIFGVLFVRNAGSVGSVYDAVEWGLNQIHYRNWTDANLLHFNALYDI
jgi:hypothetical protein